MLKKKDGIDEDGKNFNPEMGSNNKNKSPKKTYTYISHMQLRILKTPKEKSPFLDKCIEFQVKFCY